MIRILIADDFELLREDIRDTLNAQPDMRVVGEAATGAQLEALAANTPFDLALVDIEMESTTAGIRAAEHILENKPEALILFLTAHETENMILMSNGRGRGGLHCKGLPGGGAFAPYPQRVPGRGAFGRARAAYRA